MFPSLQKQAQLGNSTISSYCSENETLCFLTSKVRIYDSNCCKFVILQKHRVAETLFKNEWSSFSILYTSFAVFL